MIDRKIDFIVTVIVGMLLLIAFIYFWVYLKCGMFPQLFAFYCQ